MFIHIYLLPLHVSALVGHLQAECTIIAGSYCTCNGTVVLCAFTLLGSIYNIFGKFCSCQLDVRVGVVWCLPLPSLNLWHWKWMHYIPPKPSWTFSGPRAIQPRVPWTIVTAVRTSHPTRKQMKDMRKLQKYEIWRRTRAAWYTFVTCNFYSRIICNRAVKRLYILNCYNFDDTAQP
jgi:hypothetical protein